TGSLRHDTGRAARYPGRLLAHVSRQEARSGGGTPRERSQRGGSRLIEQDFKMSQPLNLPVLEQLTSCRNLLIAGMGGGFDIFCGLPIYFELQRRGQRVYLANFSFSNVVRHKTGVRLTETLVGVTAEHKGPVVCFPEVYLARWFREQR